MFDSIQPVTISSKAVEEIKKIMEHKSIPQDYGLRVGIRGSGCGGASLVVGFDKKGESDLSYIISGIPVYVDKKHTMYVIGKEIDILEDEEQYGFVFKDSK